MQIHESQYESEKAVVRVIPGKLTSDELKIVVDSAARKFFSDIMKSKKEVKTI